MNTTSNQRVDEVAPTYEPARRLDAACGWLYYVLVLLSFLILFPSWFNGTGNAILKVSFLVLSSALFIGFLLGKLYLIPAAERVRRKQLLANAFGAMLTPEQTTKYYNNGFQPSLQRLAANVMENAHFGKEVSKLMLVSVRIKTFVYLAAWLAVLAGRHESMDIVLWITQLVFSADILAYWLSLECLRHRHERVYEGLYQHFLHGHSQNNPKASASILDAFASYEAAKAAAGVLLDSKIFFRENPRLSEKWTDNCKKLGIPTE